VIVAGLNRVRLPLDWPLDWNIALDAPVLALTVCITLLASMLFGLAPAIKSLAPNLVSSLTGSARAGRRGPMRRGRVLVAVQVAIATVLLVCAGLFATNLRHAMAVDTGFRTDGLLLATFDPGLDGRSRVPTEEIFITLRSRLRAVPGVTSVGLAKYVPLQIGGAQRGVEIPGYQPSAGESMNVYHNAVDSAYFAAMEIPILQGRGFRQSDGEPSGRAIVVNQDFADRFWRGQSPLGKIVVANGGEWEVVGVVPTGKYLSLGEEPTAFMYFPWPKCRGPEMTVHIRVSEDPTAMIPQIGREAESVDPNLLLYDIKTMKDQLALVLLPARFGAVVLGTFGALCLVLLSVGIYGVVAYTVSRRTREVGIRIAMGAEPRNMTLHVLREQMWVVLIGVAVGVAGALAASPLVESVLYSREAFEPAVLLIVPLFLLAVAAVACYLPARRAAMVDPVQALRSE
jgi:predicted permease